MLAKARISFKTSTHHFAFTLLGDGVKLPQYIKSKFLFRKKVNKFYVVLESKHPFLRTKNQIFSQKPMVNLSGVYFTPKHIEF